ncbi:MAG: histidine kinase dimerization/phospho-acceptor domain-containing protein, partial [Sphingomicrobium sp.]
RDAVLSVAGTGPIAGEWRISGLPAFEPSGGRFAGYRGIALREMPATPLHQITSAVLSDPDSLRELVHEIKTPLNAIIGFAEIIDHQYLGPADHRYRERANEIVTQARLLLTAIDDLDFAAKTHGGAMGDAVLTNLGQLVERMAPTLRQQAAARGVELEASRALAGLTARIEPELAERLIQRMANAVIDQAGEGERLRLSVESVAGKCHVSLSRPDSLQGQADDRLFGAQQALAAGEISLRLVRGLARIAGADLISSSGTVSLAFSRG